MYTGPKLIELLEKQYQTRKLSHLFKKGTFTLNWRTKVGSFPHPDVETIVSAGEPCGAWRSQGRPEDKREIGENWEQMRELPLNGYIPASSIRGLVKAWAKKRSQIKTDMEKLLGYQRGDIIKPGKIEFLDAYPTEPTKLVLDIVNPQQDFQVYHRGQGTPLSLYTLGDGEEAVELTIAIKGIAAYTSAEDVETAWQWVQQALRDYGVGSRTAAGYGTVKPPSSFKALPNLQQSEDNYRKKQFQFTLYTQGCAGPDTQTMELRPSHWRGWLRSWVLRFMLGVMSEENAEKTVNELMGTLEPQTKKGCVRLRMYKGNIWGEESDNSPYFYNWKGRLEVSAPKEILDILVPIIRFAVTVGGVARGWRRPLHIFHMNNNGHAAARGCHLIMSHQIPNKKTGKWEKKPFRLPPKTEIWTQIYNDWLQKIKIKWANRVDTNANQQLAAEVFSPKTCAIYVVPGPSDEPLDLDVGNIYWLETNAENTRGDGMNLVYKDIYKRNPDIGGDAAGGGNSSCSWASIKRINIPNTEEDTECQEIVCLFMGGQKPSSNHVLQKQQSQQLQLPKKTLGYRSQFLQDLSEISGAVNLFGVQPQSPEPEK